MNEQELEQEQEVIENQESENQVEEQSTEQSGSDITQLSDEELSKYDSYEDFLKAQQEQSGSQESEQVVENQEQEPSDDTGSKQESTVTEEASTEMTDTEFREFLTSEFRANHRNVQVTDPHDIRKLMQYGMNFHKKMAELAPHRKILKALEQNGLTDESKVNFAIDLMQGKPEAIAQLLKQHEVDTYNLPDLEETPYQSNNYIPSDQKVEFDAIIDELKQSAHGNQVIDLLKGLDSDSFHQIYTNPVMAQNLAIHAENGLMADALALLETEKALGKVPSDINDIDAYAYVAKHLEETNPEKYYPQRKTAKVIGNNLGKQQQQQVKQNQAKLQAGIPTNQQPVQQADSQSGWDMLLNAKDEDLAKYDNWESFLAANNLNFQR